MRVGRGHGGVGWARRNSVVVFYVLAFGISWVGFLPELARLWGSFWFRSPLWVGLLVLPGVGPALAAWIAGVVEGDERGGAGAVWGSLRRWVGWVWWAGAVGIPAGTFWVASWVAELVGVRREAVPGVAGGGLVGVVVVALAANVWEEVGWRGFALGRLERRFPPLVAAGIVGVLWAAWHLPLLVIPESAMSRYPVGLWAVGTMSHSVVLAWLFNRTGRSLGVVTVCHVCWNVFGALVGVRSWGVLAGVEVAAGAGVILVSRGRLGYMEDG